MTHDPMTTDAIRVVLEDAPEVLIVGADGDGEEVLRLVAELQPDVVILDCRLPLLGGVQVAEALREGGNPRACWC